MTVADLGEIKRIEQHAGVRIDGKDARRLKAGAERANLTLAHLRWFLNDEKFAGARSRIAVPLTIAKEFRERSENIRWPEIIDQPEARGITAKEILRL